MTGKKYYYGAFLTPVFLPFLLILLEWVVSLFTGGTFLTKYSGFLLGTILFGGVPYLVFLIGFYVWSDNKTGRVIHKATYFAPVIYLILFWFWLVFFLLVTEPESSGNIFSFLISSELWDAYYFFGQIALYVSSAYIIVFNIIYWILRTSGRLVNEPAESG